MTPEEMKSYLESIEEFIYDEKKIVTCSWLAKTLGVHSNLSKQLLYTFFEGCPKKNELSITYLIIGESKNENEIKMCVVKDTDIEKAEKQMSLITSKHIFSIQKSPELVDLNVLYTAQKYDPETSLSNGISGITFKCNQRDTALIEDLKSKALPVLSKKPVVNTKKPQPQSNAQVSDTKKPGGTYNLFGKQKPKSVADKPEDRVENTVNKDSKNNEALKGEKETIPSKTGKKPSNVKTGSIGAFFNKASSKPNPPTQKPATKAEEVEPMDQEQSPSKENKPTLNISQEKEALKPSPKAAEPEEKNNDVKAKKSKKVTNTKSKKKPQKKSAKDTKKRSRLVVLSDSESNSSEEEAEEVEREATPEPQATIIADDEDMDDIICATPEPTTKKRKKKLVSKTFMSADGFMETQKVYESFSEEEEEEKMPEKKLKTTHESPKDETKDVKENTSKVSPKTEVQKKTNPPKKTQSPQKTKQASLTSFFKKK